VPERFHAAPAQTKPAAVLMTPADGPWWHPFDDAQLDKLVEQAMASSPTLAQATARLSQAQARLQTQQAAAAPQVSLSAAAVRQGGPLLNAAGDTGTLWSAQVQGQMTLDWLGLLQTAQAARQHDAQAAEQTLAVARLLLQTEVVQQYWRWRAAHDEWQLATLQHARQQQALGALQQRVQGGTVAALALAPVQQALARAEADLAGLLAERDTALNQLAWLTGQAPSTLNLDGQAAWQGHDVPDVPAGLPSQLLVRRADVLAAQAGLQAALMRAGMARQAWWPQLALTASGGQAASNWRELLQATARSWGLGLVGSLPVFDGGRRQADQRLADADVQAAAAAYQQAVFTAFREVEDALVGQRAASQLGQARHQAVLSAEQITRVARQRLALGLGPAQALWQAEVDEAAQRREWVRAQAQQRQAHASLIRALGGSWGG